MSKKRVRERMARTGESYQQALVAMRDGKPEPLRMAGPIVSREELLHREDGLDQHIPDASFRTEFEEEVFDYQDDVGDR